MSQSSFGSPQGSRPPGRNRANIELTIFGFLVSLAVKSALDTAYGKSIPQNAHTVAELNSALSSFSTLQLCVFLLTIIRFVYGAYRFQEESPEELSQGAIIWNLVGTLVLFVLFYIAGLAILDADTFYIALVYAHIWDLLWVAGLFLCFKGRQAKTKSVMQKFMAIDLIAIVLIPTAQKYWHHHFMGTAAGIMVALTIADVLWNYKFFFFPDLWRSGH